MKQLVLLMLLTFSINLLVNASDPIMVLNPSFAPTTSLLSASERYLVLEDDQQYEVWDIDKQQQILQGSYKHKISNWFAGANIDEGSGFVLIENKNLFLTIEYTLNKAHIKAFDLDNGNQIWENDEVSFGTMWLNSITSLLLSAPKPNVNVGNSRQEIQIHHQISQGSLSSNDFAIEQLIHYVEQLDALLINGTDGLQYLELMTGNVSWIQEEVKTMLGELIYDPGSHNLIAISIHSSELAGLVSRPNIYLIDANDGTSHWVSQYIGNYRPGSTYVFDNLILTDFFGLSFIDINTGEKPDNEVNENYSKAEDALRVLSRFQPDEPIETITTDPLFVDNSRFYYAVGMHRGNAHPMTGNKVVQKIDPNSGSIVFQSENLGGNQDNPIQKELAGEILYVKMTRRNQTYIHGIQAANGEILFSTDRIRNRHDSDFDPFFIHENTIIDLASNGIYFYDALRGTETNVIPFKDLDIGRLNNYTAFSRGFVISGNRGLALVDINGEILQTLNIRDLQSFSEVNEKIYIVGNGEIYILDKDSLDKSFSMEYKNDEFVVTGSGSKYWLHVTNSAIHIYPM